MPGCEGSPLAALSDQSALLARIRNGARQVSGGHPSVRCRSSEVSASCRTARFLSFIIASIASTFQRKLQARMSKPLQSSRKRPRSNDADFHDKRLGRKPASASTTPSIPPAAYVQAYEAQLIYVRADVADGVAGAGEKDDGTGQAPRERARLVPWAGTAEGVEEGSVWADRCVSLTSPHRMVDLPLSHKQTTSMSSFERTSDGGLLSEARPRKGSRPAEGPVAPLALTADRCSATISCTSSRISLPRGSSRARARLAPRRPPRLRPGTRCRPTSKRRSTCPTRTK